MAIITENYKNSDYFVGKKVGLIALRTDHLIEDALSHILHHRDISMLTNRITFNDPINQQNLLAMEQDLDRCCHDLLPNRDVDVVIFGCSSGTVAIGESLLEEKITRIKPSAKVTNPVTAAMAAFAKLGVKKVSIVTPYIEEVNQSMAEFFTEKGLEVLNVTGFGVHNDEDITRIDPEAIVSAAKEHIAAGSEALFLSCTAMRSIEAIQQLEEALNIPVVTSNQALCWHALTLLDLPTNGLPYGKLFQ